MTIFGEDTRSHILGTHIFAVGREYRSTGILQAALRVALRQEINVAFFTRKPIQLLSAYFRVNDDSSTADQGSDWSWTLRIIVLCADVLNHCYCSPAGDEQEPSQPWAELAERAESWLRHKPASFEPLRCRERDPGRGRAFPEVWLLNDCHGPQRPLSPVMRKKAEADSGNNSCWTHLLSDVPHPLNRI